MKRFILIALLSYSFSAFAQLSIDYDIYLRFDSSKSNIEFFQHKMGDSCLYRSFVFKKIRPIEMEKHYIFVSDDGKLQKGIKGDNDRSKYFKLKLIHHSSKNIYKQVSKIENLNFLDFMELQNIKFSNLLDILRDAKNIYVIDIAESNDNNMMYTAYEVILN